MVETFYRACHLCEAMCGVAITVEGGAIAAIRGDPEDPLSRGHICPKALGLKDVHEDPDRLRRPLVRRGDRWEELGWDQALDEAAQRLAAVRDRHGKSALAFYQGNPTVHSHGALLFGQVLARALGTPNNFSATSLDQLPHMLAALQMFGHQLLLPVPDLDRTQLLLVFGANPAASNGSLMTAGDVKGRIRAIRSRGGRVLLFDPRRTETAALADRHYFVRPGGDVFLLAALVVEVARLMGGPRPGRIAGFVDGLDRALAALQPFTADTVAGAAGLTPAEIREIARELAGAPSAAVYGRVGVSTQEFGGLCGWLLFLLNIITGNLDREGGVMFPRPAVDLIGIASALGLRGSFARRKSRVRGLPEFGGELPTAALAEEIEVDGPGRIRGLITSAGNPVLSAPNGKRLERSLGSLEVMVSIDIYLNETTRHAHYILPPTFALEHPHYDLVFHALAVRNTARFGEAVFERGADQRHDWEIMAGLARRLARRTVLSRWIAPLEERMLSLGPDPIVALGLELGPYGRRRLRDPLTLEKLRRAPHGVDLGPLSPCLPDRLRHADRRIRAAPEIYLRDLERAKERLARSSSERPALSLIGRRELRSNNSWMHNSLRLVKGQRQCTLRMHPDDGARRGLADGATVEVRTDSGAIRVVLELSDEMMPGVVSLPHGWGHHRPGARLAVAEKHAGASLNDLTLDTLIDELTGTARFSGVPVEVHAT
jgi:anaerobic selenocysteine-containing dehydrogenase